MSEETDGLFPAFGAGAPIATLQDWVNEHTPHSGVTPPIFGRGQVAAEAFLGFVRCVCGGWWVGSPYEIDRILPEQTPPIVVEPGDIRPGAILRLRKLDGVWIGSAARCHSPGTHAPDCQCAEVG